jgi:hypothetical protein
MRDIAAGTPLDPPSWPQPQIGLSSELAAPDDRKQAVPSPPPQVPSTLGHEEMVAEWPTLLEGHRIISSGARRERHRVGTRPVAT